MKIIKRNGAEESFDTLKIVNAVQKACNATENAYLAPEQLTDIADYVEYKCNKLGRAVSVEEIQDMVENQEDAGLALNCPNCGAPLPALGAKKCIYCDTPIVEYNLRIWNFSRVEEA